LTIVIALATKNAVTTKENAMGTLITKVQSSTNPAQSYDILLGGDGNVYCTCPGWKYQKLPPKERTCKHMKALSSKIAAFTKGLGAPKAAPVATKPVAKPSAPLSPVQAPIAQTAKVVAAVEAFNATAVAPVAAPVAPAPVVDAKAAKIALAQAKVKAAQAALALAQAEVELAEALAA
jgi:hypothetical protein